MKEENLNKLKKIPDWIQKLIEDEVGEYKTLPGKLSELQSNHNSLQRESKRDKEKNEFLQKIQKELFGALDKLVELKVLEFKEDGEHYCDDYGNGGGWRHSIWSYKGEIIYEDGESF